MTIKPKWRCDECYGLHTYEDDAEIAAEAVQDDGKQFPEGITDPAEYVQAYCRANGLTT